MEADYTPLGEDDDVHSRLLEGAIFFGDRMRELGRLEERAKREPVSAVDLHNADAAAMMAWGEVLAVSSAADFGDDADDRINAADRFDQGDGPWFLFDHDAQ